MCGGGGSPGAGMLIDHGMSLHYVSGRVMRAGIRSLRVSECARARAGARTHVCVCKSWWVYGGRENFQGKISGGPGE